MAPAKPWLLHRPGTCPVREKKIFKKKESSHTHTRHIHIMKWRTVFTPVHMDKGTLDTAAWIVFQGVLREDKMRVGRGEDQKEKKQAVPLKMCAPQACLFAERKKKKKHFPSTLGGQWLFLLLFPCSFFARQKQSVYSLSSNERAHCCCHALPSHGNCRTQSHFTT